MMAGIKIARLREFEDEPDFRNRPPYTRHHDQSACVLSTFVKDVQSMVNVMEDFGNPFEEESQGLLVLDTKKIAPPAAIDALRRAHKTRTLHFDNFVQERLVERTKPLEDAIHRHKLKIFGQPPKVPGKGANQVKSLKNDVNLFSRLYIGCRNRDGNLEEVFKHEKPRLPSCSLRWRWYPPGCQE